MVVMIRFLLNDELIELADPGAELTVLEWLRTHQQLSGTKEGCGSGDCGACTVVMVSASDTPGGLPLSYTPANACILLIGALHGRQLVTVEHLGSPVELHPAQSAMVEHHGSQCGFCTPGFVMSLFALFHQNLEAEELFADAEQRHSLIEQYLGGNLCRCTGYHPIIKAAEQLLQARFRQNVTDHFDARAAHTAEVLLGLGTKDQTVTAVSRIQVPVSLVEALALWSDQPDAHIVAGGTDKGLEITQQLSSWSSVIHIGNVAELHCIEHRAEYLLVGAGVSITELLNTLSLDYPDALPMLLRFGSEQVRAQATVGGNLGTASPIGDLPPLLLALGASIDLVSLNADDRTLATRNLPLADYFTGYRQTQRQDNEWIQSVRIPCPNDTEVLRVYKISKRMDDDISAVCAAIWLQWESADNPTTVRDVRLGFGGMAATPKQATAAEHALRGAKLDNQSIAAACAALAHDFKPIDDARASAQYRQRIAENLLQRFLIDVGQSNEPVDITAFAVGYES